MISRREQQELDRLEAVTFKVLRAADELDARKERDSAGQEHRERTQ